MRRPGIRPFFVIPAILIALGCGKPRLVYTVDEAFRPGSYRTVAPDPRKDRIIIREGMRPLNPELHLRAALAELATRRYLLTPATEADIWVVTYVLIGGQPDGGHSGGGKPSHSEGSGEGHHRGGRGAAGGAPPFGSGRESGARSDFTVIIVLEDRKTGRPVWRGEMTQNPKDKDAEGRPLGIEAVVHQLLQPLPSMP